MQLRQNQPFSPSQLVAPTPPSAQNPSDQIPSNINAVANSTGGTGFGSQPDFSANPGLRDQLMAAMHDYTYSFPAGGYIRTSDAANANSYWNKFGAGSGGDPTANRAMEQLYGQVGDLPTQPVTTRALSKLYQSGQAEPGPGGPSYNETLGRLFEDPNMAGAAREAGFTDRYRGLFQFGERTPYYNPFGQYHPPPNG